MREVKFRAWDKTNKQMHYLGELERATLTLGGDELVLITHNDHYIDSSEPLSDVVLMQFTGLTDKNGREVFEDDIVRGDQHDVAVVEWQDNIDTDRDWRYASGFSFDLLETIHVMISGDKTQLLNVEVIGNVREHPEMAPKEL